MRRLWKVPKYQSKYFLPVGEGRHAALRGEPFPTLSERISSTHETMGSLLANYWSESRPLAPEREQFCRNRVLLFFSQIYNKGFSFFRATKPSSLGIEQEELFLSNSHRARKTLQSPINCQREHVTDVHHQVEYASIRCVCSVESIDGRKLELNLCRMCKSGSIKSVLEMPYNVDFEFLQRV